MDEEKLNEYINTNSQRIRKLGESIKDVNRKLKTALPEPNRRVLRLKRDHYQEETRRLIRITGWLKKKLDKNKKTDVVDEATR